jgi:hypothetical protein
MKRSGMSENDESGCMGSAGPLLATKQKNLREFLQRYRPE